MYRLSARGPFRGRRSGLVLVMLASVALAAQQPQNQEIGALDKQKAEKAFPAKPIYSPYAGRTYPARPGRPTTQSASARRRSPARG